MFLPGQMHAGAEQAYHLHACVVRDGSLQAAGNRLKNARPQNENDCGLRCDE